MKTGFPAPVCRNGTDLYEIDGCAPQLRAVREGKLELHALSKGHYPGNRMKSNILPGLSSVGFWNCRRARDWGLDPHRNEGLELVFLRDGTTAFEVDGTAHQLRAGDLGITRPWQLHRLGNPHIGRCRLSWLILDLQVRRQNQRWKWPAWVVLSPRDLSELTRKLRQGTQPAWRANPAIREVFRELDGCVPAWPANRAASRMAVAVNRLLVELLEILSEQPARESRQRQSSRVTVDLFLKNLSDDPAACTLPWSLASMAAHCGMGITAMTQYCRELVNNGPVAYLNLCRLEHAARALVAEPHLSVTQIAMRAGFNSSQYFATSFRRRFGTTPLRHRHAAEPTAG
jgi:AraC-like DNA-binding protein